MKEPQLFRTLGSKIFKFLKNQDNISAVMLYYYVYCPICFSSNYFSCNYRSQTTHITMMCNVELQDKNNFLYELNTYVHLVNSFSENLIQVVVI